MTPDRLDDASEALFALAIEIAAADTARDSDGYWRVIRQLHGRPNRQAFERAAACCRSVRNSERLVGADVLAQLGSADDRGARPFTDKTVPLLRAMLTDEDTAVIAAAIHALAHHRQSVVDDHRELARHPSRDIREAVAHALTGHGEAEVIALLLELTADVDDAVRDWATFAIGTQTDADTPQIRKALADRLTDSDEEVRGEALVGLARRRDRTVIESVIQALQSPNASRLVFDAAEELLSAYPDDYRLTVAVANRRSQ
jgi:HEAT repeat protein